MTLDDKYLKMIVFRKKGKSSETTLSYKETNKEIRKNYVY